MKRYLPWAPLGLILAGLAGLVFGIRLLQQPIWPTWAHQGFQSFIGVLMLLLQF